MTNNYFKVATYTPREGQGPAVESQTFAFNDQDPESLAAAINVASWLAGQSVYSRLSVFRFLPTRAALPVIGTSKAFS